MGRAHGQDLPKVLALMQDDGHGMMLMEGSAYMGIQRKVFKVVLWWLGSTRTHR